MKKWVWFVLINMCQIAAFAQSHVVSGSLADGKDQSPLINAVVQIAPAADTSGWNSTVSDLDGKFSFTAVADNSYLLKVTYIGYATKLKFFQVKGADVNLGPIAVSQNARVLNSVTVEEKAIRVQQKSDTTEFNAGSFKTNRDATAEELVTKMPGITNENGTIKAQGEQVQKVTVDGKEFFGDDVSLALRNLPSEVVGGVQVYDRMNDQSAFIGFNDGNTQKTMNIVTKNGRNNGVFGKIYAGAGYISDPRYQAGANINWFEGNRRLSLIAMSNNTNQQNFSIQDIAGATGASMPNFPGGGRGGGSGGPGGGRRGGGGGGGMGNDAIQNFMTGQQGGISTTHAAGLNFSDVWGKRKNFKFTGSYFFNYSDNGNTTDLTRKYLNAGDSSTVYTQHNTTNSININHRLNFRMEWAIDSFTTAIFTPKFTWQTNRQSSATNGLSTIAGSEFLSNVKSEYSGSNKAYTVGGDLLVQHKFRGMYQTVSLNLGTNITNRDGNSAQQSNSLFSNPADTVLLDQKGINNSRSYNVYGNLTFTDALSKSAMVQVNYQPSVTWSKSDKETFNRNSGNGEYNLRDTLLSSQYNSTYLQQRGGISFRFKGQRWNMSVGTNLQYARLTGQTIYPTAFATDHSFLNMLPVFSFDYRFKNNSNLRINYRTNTSPPSMTQLQSVVDNSNPLVLSTGNPDLKQNYSHFIMARYNFANMKKGTNFFLFAMFNYVQNYVANTTIVAQRDTVVRNIALRAGSQLTLPQNLDGYMNANLFLNYGFPLSRIKCNMNLNAGVMYTRTPGVVNNLFNYSNNAAPTAGFNLSSNISEKIDFSIGYRGSYNIVKNMLATVSSNNYYTHSANLRFNWLFWKGFVVNTTMENTLYRGLQNYNQNIFIWNAALGYKFLKDKSLELRVSVNDILNQNSGVSRTVTETYIEDSRNRVLQRYWMATLTWTIRYFKKPAESSRP
ncbi:MAG: outer membrane beta-barrel protein [Chitinophagales bacterium]